MAGGGGVSGLLTGKSGSNESAVNAQDAALRQAADKQAARNAINAAFGIAPTLDNINPAAFQYASRKSLQFNPNNGHIHNGGFLGAAQNFFDAGGALFGGGTKYHNKLDQAAYDQAMAAYNQELADAASNKSARDALYDQVRSDAFGAGKTSLDDNKTSAARNNKFALFAQGLNGGSQDIDESALLDRTYNQGLLDLGAKADAARAGLRGADETSRLGLLTSVDNGMSTSDALSSALTQMKTGADQAEAAAKGTSLGDLFGNAGLLYTKSAAARGAQSGMNYWQNLFPQAAQLSGGKGGGIVTSTGG